MMPHIPTILTADRLAVRTTGLTKEFGKEIALSSLELTVPEGAFYVLVGPNGAGKTTLLKLLIELLAPSCGAIDVLGMDPTRQGARIRALVGYVPERSEDLYDWMSVDQALTHHRSYFPAWDAQYAAELMRRLNVKHGKLKRLSKGELRRVQIVMALAHRPPLLLLDEPSDGLDPLGREMLYGILAEHIATTPTTVVVSTHLVFELERLADHVAVLSEGHLLAQLTTDELHAHLKRYVIRAGDLNLTAPRDAAVVLNGSDREHAWTLWGDEQQLTAQLRDQGADVRDVRPLTLHEAAVAFLAMERV